MEINKRELVARLAHIMQSNLKPEDGLDGDETEELGLMFQEQLDYLNGNLDKTEIAEKNIITHI